MRRATRAAPTTRQRSGLTLQPADIPVLALHAQLSPDELRQQLRALKQHVRMDVLQHPDGVWEIVYEPTYARSPRPSPGLGRRRTPARRRPLVENIPRGTAEGELPKTSRTRPPLRRPAPSRAAAASG
ncbi:MULTISPECIES: hypothetical protein [unclassified Streptomyces]|uniref:hypothetical protein n=1 Tax=unclassified Streptomyces TaxID=2593676 RepID=UPI002E1944BC|nr:MULTISPECIES: hypothetical protein [unclassified Streptomyces]